MDKQAIIKFFDNLAPSWDAGMIRNEAVIERILDIGGIKKDALVLDVACGTGVLFPDYLKRECKLIVGVDISAQMIKIAAQKFNNPRIMLINDDVMNLSYRKYFDCCMIYNAFPHFINPQALLKSLHTMLKDNGRLTIAHGMSREMLNLHHAGISKDISSELISAQELARLFVQNSFAVDTVISDDKMYAVSARAV